MKAGGRPAFPQPWPGPGPATHSGQGQVRAAQSGEAWRRPPPIQGSAALRGPGHEASEEVLGEGKRKWRPKAHPGTSGLTCWKDGFGGNPNQTTLVAWMVQNLPARPPDTGSIPGLGRFPGEGNGNPLQLSCLEDPMDRGAWWATVHRVQKSWT